MRFITIVHQFTKKYFKYFVCNKTQIDEKLYLLGQDMASNSAFSSQIKCNLSTHDSNKNKWCRLHFYFNFKGSKLYSTR